MYMSNFIVARFYSIYHPTLNGETDENLTAAKSGLNKTSFRAQ